VWVWGLFVVAFGLFVAVVALALTGDLDFG
jgi:hypothetical protein